MEKAVSDVTLAEEVAVVPPEALVDPREPTVEDLFRPLYDNYVAIENGPAIIENQEGEEKLGGFRARPIIAKYDRTEILALRSDELRRYVSVSFQQGDILIDPSVFAPGQPISFSDMVDSHINHNLQAARERRLLAEAELPAHITVSETDIDPETTSKFMKMFRSLGSGALKLIPDLHFHSAPISLPSKES
jgi:hypothetical protein